MAIQLWKDREKRIIVPELFSTYADEFAKKISSESTRTRNKGTQLRRFYDEISRLNARAQMPDAEWNLILPQVHMVIAKTAYAKGRDLVSESFVNLMREGITQIQDSQDLKIFSTYLEAFMGFYKMYKND